MRQTAFRRSWSPIEQTSIPSMMIFPDDGSTNRRRLVAKVDLPLPVRPTKPIFERGANSTERDLMTAGSSGA